MTELNNSAEVSTVEVPTTQTAPPSAPAFPLRRVVWGVAFLAAMVIIALVGMQYLSPKLHGILLESPRVADDFTLPTSTGETMSLSDFRGKYVVLFFGYTYCPDVCPITINELQQMVKTLGPKRADDVQVLMISVDPERDTPEQLATYLGYFDPNFIGMTGTVDDIQPIASQFGIYFERQPGSENTGYLVDHTAAVTVIDPEGHVRIIFSYGVKGADMASDLSYLMRRG